MCGQRTDDTGDQRIRCRVRGDHEALPDISTTVVTTVDDHTLPLDAFQRGIDARTRSEPVGRVVLWR